MQANSASKWLNIAFSVNCGLKFCPFCDGRKILYSLQREKSPRSREQFARSSGEEEAFIYSSRIKRKRSAQWDLAKKLGEQKGCQEEKR
ncbi:hypothetical protein CDAR_225661 [Caerostris darwini]|uniref:Uncharacterized protein n=1 Tax=Caerostris darwini TaxID=1538125 RepID=A0AAV4TKR0_9ARAC|nr:hypothetical protein CDAR_225661 [Caerostris darwini]